VAIWDRLFAADPKEGKTKDPPKGVAGADGPQIYSEMIVGGEDLNREWDGRGKYPIIEEMRKSDPCVRSNLFMYKGPIIGADWSFDPADDGEAKDRLIADCASWQFGLEAPATGPMDLGWKEGRRQDLLFLDFGAHFTEDSWDKDLTDWKDADGDVHKIRTLLRLAPRFASTVGEMDTDKATGAITKFIQDLPQASPIPPEKLTAYVFDREGNNLFGTSFLRSMFGAWRMKKAMMLSSAIGWDRYAAGVPVVRYPMGTSSTHEAKAKLIGRNYRQHERGYIVLEGSKEEGWDVEIIGGAATMADPVPLLNKYDEQMSMAGLTMFSQLGITQSGSRAVGDVLRDPYLEALGYVADLLIEAFSRGPLRRWVDHNFGREFDLPILKVSGLAAKNIEMVVSAIATLSGAGFNFASPDDQDLVRNLLDFPALPEDLRKAAETAQEAGFAVQAANLENAKKGILPGQPPKEGDSPAEPQPRSKAAGRQQPGQPGGGQGGP